MRYLMILSLFVFGNTLIGQTTRPKTYNSTKDSDPKAKSILKQVKDQLQIDKGVSINFEFRYIPSESSPTTQTGLAKIKGKKLNLDLIDQTLISDGITLWTILKKRNEVQINDAVAIQNDPMSPYRLLQIHDSPEFTYVLAGDTKVNGVIRDIIEFKPLDKDAEFFKVRAEIDRVKKEYRNITLYLKTGDQYALEIKSQSNKIIPEIDFTWDAKKNPGMKVEDLR